MRPRWLTTRIFLDGGDPEETRKTVELLGFLDGQTTNPTLVSKNPEVKQRLDRGEKFTKEEILDFYRETIVRISTTIPGRSVSIEVYSDASTSAEEMFAQAVEMNSWTHSAHIKFPITAGGLKAAQMAVKDFIRVNMTLCFSQEQAAAVHCAVGDARKGWVFVSPFIGRLDDIGLRGVDLVTNILKMYRETEDKGFGYVEVLGASVRNVNQALYLIKHGVEIITAPFSVLVELANYFKMNENKAEEFFKNFELSTHNLKSISYVPDISLTGKWRDLNIQHDLTDTGLKRFADDWNKLIF